MIYLSTFYKRFYELYEDARTEGLGRKEFAVRCNISAGKLNGYLRGTSEPCTEDLKKIAIGNNTTVSWLVGESSIQERSATFIMEDLLGGLNKKQYEYICVFIQFVKTLQMK